MKECSVRKRMHATTQDAGCLALAKTKSRAAEGAKSRLLLLLGGLRLLPA